MRYDIQCNMIRCDTIMIGIVIRYDIWYIYPYVYASKLGYCTSCTSLYYDLQYILHIPYIWASSPQPICIYSSRYLNGSDALKPNMAQVGRGCRHFCKSSRTTGLWPCGTDFPNRSAHRYLEPTVIFFGDCRNIAYERRKLSYTLSESCVVAFPQPRFVVFFPPLHLLSHRFANNFSSIGFNHHTYIGLVKSPSVYWYHLGTSMLSHLPW